ncbi:MAG: hypothetical protein LBC74_02590, partial [Planctomycetaceae bacterium]|nr:hypothetical protein [Planctomycetaceae bacterium]
IIVTKNSEVETIWIATNAGLVKLNNDFSKLDFGAARIMRTKFVDFMAARQKIGNKYQKKLRISYCRKII